ncbi:MAG: WPE palindromic element domain-containing protein [Wolbachia sp.]
MTLGSRLGTKLVNTKALYNVFDGTVRKDWIPVSRTGMTPFVVNSLLLYGLAAILNGYQYLPIKNNHVFPNNCNFRLNQCKLISAFFNDFLCFFYTNPFSNCYLFSLF